MTSRSYRRGSVLVVVAAMLWFLLPGVASAAVTVSRAEVSGDRLRIEGQAAPSRPITVDDVTMTTSGSSGSFRIERSGYTRPADCTVDVDDGSGAVSARLSGCTVTTAPPPPPPSATATLAGLSVSPTSLQGGGTTVGTVTLTAAAPAGDAVVELSSDNAALAVPATVTVPAGATSQSASMSTTPVAASTAVTVSARYAGETRTAVVTVTAPPPSGATLDGLSLNPSTVQTGTTGTSATLTFSAPTPTGGATVALLSRNPSLATVPSTVTVPATSSTGAFPVTIDPSGSGTATIEATYEGATRSAVLTVTTQTLFRIITESPLPNARVGQNYAGYIEACCGQGTPYRWSLVSGTVPDGLRFAGDSLRLSRTTGVTGVPTRVQTTTFTVRARDGAGNTATKTFTLTVDPAAPLTINSPSQLTTGRVGASYFANLFGAGGVPPYRWTRTAGTLPPGLSLQASPGRIQGTPTTAGSYTFTLRVDDSGGQSTTGQFSILITQ